MREVWAKAAVGDGASHRVTVDAGRQFKYPLPWGTGTIHGRRLMLLLNPAIELGTRLNVDAQQHLRVLRPAILRALAQIDSALVGSNPHAVRVVRNQIGLARQARNPETVVGVRRQK